MTSFMFDGVSSDEYEYLKINKITTSILPPIEQKIHELIGRDGAYHYGREIRYLIHTIEITIRGYDRASMTQQKRELASWLLTDSPRSLIYSYEPDKEYLAVLDGETDLDEIIGIGKTELRFIIPDPWAQGLDEHSHEIFPAPIVMEDINTPNEWENADIENLDIDNDGARLATVGSNYEYSDQNWDNGSVENLSIVNGALQLTKSGADYNHEEAHVQDFQGTANNVKIVSSEDLKEDFEDTEFTFNFTTPPEANTGWERITTESFEGVGCYASTIMNPIPAQHQFSQSDFTFSVPIGANDANFELMYRVSSEENFDFFRIYINNEQVLEDSGIKPWTKFSYDLEEGAVYNIRLEYHIDGATIGGEDRAYIDNIKVSYVTPNSLAKIVIDDMPDYDFRDGMDDYTRAWRGSTTLGVVQEDGYVTINSSPNGITSMQKTQCVKYPFTLDIRGMFGGHTQTYISDGVSLFVVTMPDTGGVERWVRFRIVDNQTMYVYMDGDEINTITSTNDSAALNRITLCYSDSVAGNTCSINAVYFAGQDLGEPETNYVGSYQSPTYDLSSVGLLHESVVTPTTSPEVSPYTGMKYGYTFEIRTVDIANDTYGEWTDGNVFDTGDDLDGMGFQWRIIMDSDDLGGSPSLSSVTQEFTAAHAHKGTYTSNELTDIQQVVRARNSLLSWVANTPSETSVTIEITWDNDDWVTAFNNQPIPDLDITNDLTNESLRYRVTLQTSNTSITPIVGVFNLSMTTAYHYNAFRRSEAVSLAPIEGEAETSLITWDVTPNASPDVIVFVQIVEAGEPYNDDDWVQAMNGQPIPDIEGLDLTNKDIYTLVRLESPNEGDTTPEIHRLYWMVQAPTDDMIEYEGTIDSAPIFTVAFIGDTDNFSIRHDEKGDQLIFDHDFSVGDELIINCLNGRVTLNGVNALPYMDISSNWIKMRQGKNTFTITPLDKVNVDVVWKERYL